MLPWSATLTVVLLTSCRAYELVEHLTGTVSGGETKAFSFVPAHTLLLCLDSREGDADLYVSTSTSHPDADHHDYSSTSTGVDVLVIPSQQSGFTVYLGVHGHVRHNYSVYDLYLLSPSEEEIRSHQVWEYDHEAKMEKLVIDVDPLWLANDPKLHQRLEVLKEHSGRDGAASSKSAGWVYATFEWSVWVLIKLIEIAADVAL